MLISRGFDVSPRSPSTILAIFVCKKSSLSLRGLGPHTLTHGAVATDAVEKNAINFWTLGGFGKPLDCGLV